MLTANVLAVLAVASGLLTAAFWLRVAASPSLRSAARLDGTEPMAERANRRALAGAFALSALTVLIAVAAYLAARDGGAF